MILLKFYIRGLEILHADAILRMDGKRNIGKQKTIWRKLWTFLAY